MRVNVWIFWIIIASINCEDYIGLCNITECYNILCTIQISSAVVVGLGTNNIKFLSENNFAYTKGDISKHYRYSSS